MISEEIDEETQEKIATIARRYNIEKDRAMKGYLFADYISTGEKRTVAHRLAFGSTVDESKKLSTNLYNTKWVQEMLLIAKRNDETFYTELRFQVIERLSEVINDRFSTTKDMEAAARTLKSYIDPQLKRADESKDKQDEDESVLIMKDLMKKIETAASGNQMINSSGEIVEVRLIDD